MYIHVFGMYAKYLSLFLISFSCVHIWDVCPFPNQFPDIRPAKFHNEGKPDTYLPSATTLKLFPHVSWVKQQETWQFSPSSFKN